VHPRPKISIIERKPRDHPLVGVTGRPAHKQHAVDREPLENRKSATRRAPLRVSRSATVAKRVPIRLAPRATAPKAAFARFLGRSTPLCGLADARFTLRSGRSNELWRSPGSQQSRSSVARLTTPQSFANDRIQQTVMVPKPQNFMHPRRS